MLALIMPIAAAAQTVGQSSRGLELFAFLIGNWRCEVTLPNDQGGVDHQNATWKARYALDGKAIFEEYRSVDEAGNVVVEGANFRTYDTEEGRFLMHWTDVLHGDFVELGPPDLGGVSVTPKGISFKFRSGGILARARFEDISPDYFTWHGDASPDNGKTWQLDTIVVYARRVK